LCKFMRPVLHCFCFICYVPEKSKDKVVWPKVVNTLETKFKITAKFGTYK